MMGAKEKKVVEEALAAIPQKYQLLHPHGRLQHRVLKMLMEWIRDLLTFKEKNKAPATASDAVIVNSSDEDMKVNNGEGTTADIDNDFGDESEDGFDENASEENGTDVAENDATNSGDGEQLEDSSAISQAADNTIKDTIFINPFKQPKISKDKVLSRGAETSAFGAALLAIPTKYKEAKFRASKNHRVILLLRMWIADLKADAEEIERKKEIELLNKVDGTSEAHRLRTAHNILLGQLVELSKGLEGMDHETRKAKKKEIDHAIRDSWICLTYNSVEDA